MTKLHLMKIVHDPKHGLKINDKSAQPLVDYIISFAATNDFNLHEMIAILADTIGLQAAGADYEDADGQHMLRFSAEMLGMTYNNAMQGFAEGAINNYEIPPSSPHGAH